MFKFAKYFFAVFLITTVIPLVLMLVWNHQQMEHMRMEREQHLLDVGVKQLKNTIKQYLEIQESYILKITQNLPMQKISLQQLQDIFKADKTDWAYDQNLDKVTSYYEMIKNSSTKKPELYLITIVPFKNTRAIRIMDKVDLNQLRPAGPFDIEIYKGNEINRKSFIATIKDPFFPPDINIKHQSHFDNQFTNIHKSTEFNKVEITDNTGKTVATLLIRHGRFPKPMGPKNPLESGFGLIILFAGTASSLLVGFYINKNFINPLIALSKATKAVQEGNLSFELDTHNKQEQILNTFDNFNQMIKGLKEKEEIRKSFITNLTHDLRTPLIAQERSLELISKEFEALNLKDAYELAKGIEKNNKHLLRMVNLILESYRFDSENLNLIITDINISELIDSCYEKLKPLAAEKRIQLLKNIPENFPALKGDATSFKRVFLNLISNAIENITINGEILINTEIQENHILIHITDNGPGIAEEDLAHIFDRYYTGKSDERKIGAGLGLFVCKKLVEMHNGEIAVESQKNNYTRFSIKLPIII